MISFLSIPAVSATLAVLMLCAVVFFYMVQRAHDRDRHEYKPGAVSFFGMNALGLASVLALWNVSPALSVVALIALGLFAFGVSMNTVMTQK